LVFLEGRDHELPLMAFDVWPQLLHPCPSHFHVLTDERPLPETILTGWKCWDRIAITPIPVPLHNHLIADQHEERAVEGGDR
jgi:hypothetical protein